MRSQGKKRALRRKVCPFQADKNLAAALDYKNVDLLKRFVTDRGKIVPRRITGVSAPFQRKLTREIKRARSIALLPFSAGI